MEKENINRRGKVKTYAGIKNKKKLSLCKVMAGGLVIAIIIGGTLVYLYKKTTDVTPLNDFVNKTGQTTLISSFNTDVKSNEFVIFDAGNYDDRTLFLNRKMKYCNENDISLGFVIDSDAQIKYEIYDDIEYAKSIISKYYVDFPVYISIDKIMSNENLNTSQKIDLIKTFLDKAKENGMYVGICGTDTNLCNFNKYCFDISEYNIYLKMDSNIIKYENKCSIVEDLHGNLTSDKDYASVIEKENFNERDNFIEDAYYVVDEDDTIEEISLKFGLSVIDLLRYNELNKGDFKSGLVLRIPTENQKLVRMFEKNINENAIRCGVDLSKYQTEIDWDKLNSNVDFVIIKATESTRQDPLFLDHVENCKQNEIPIGVYSITRATTVEDIRKEAELLVEMLQDKDITYPVYIDFENNMNNEYEKEIWEKITNNGNIKELLKEWNRVISEAGYIPGIYCNKSTYKSIYDQTDSANNNFLDSFETWIAGSDIYSTDYKFEDIKDPGFKTSYQDLEIICNMRQVSEACLGTGAGTENGYVDFNYCYTDYENYGYKYEFDIKRLNDKNIKDMIVTIAATIAGAVIVISGTTLIVYIKRKNKYKNITNNKKNI